MARAGETEAWANPAEPDRAALHHGSWRGIDHLSSTLERVERFLGAAGFDRAPWLAVAFMVGIFAWFALPSRGEWLAFLAGCLALAMGMAAGLREDGRYPFLRQAGIAVALALAAGCATVWAKSALVGTPSIARPWVGELSGTVLSRSEQVAEGRVRLVLATREPGTARAVRVRLNVPLQADRPGLVAGAQVRLRARLLPPSPPMVPGSYDFARAAWFDGLAATGSLLGEVTIEQPGTAGASLDGLRHALTGLIHARIPGSAGGIGAALATGERGGIAENDAQAMRDSGLAHLLSVSGLHVTAVVGAAWLLTVRLLGLFPTLALRVPLPLVAALAGAFSAVLYTLLTGAEVPTVRACIGSLLVLAALAIGRDPLSFRMLAVAAFGVMLFWPEAVVGPSFQMSFAAVIAIIGLHGAAPVKAFLAAREESWLARACRRAVMLLLTGLVIELALMPIALFHFHRSGFYGALANMAAIPLTTFVAMPVLALALVLEPLGLGAPAWWLADRTLNLMLWLANWVSAQPGAVSTLPAMGRGAMALFVVGGLWLALWRGPVRLAGLVPVMCGVLVLATLRPPDVLVSRDGRHVGLTGLAGEDMVVLRNGRSRYVRDNLTETAGMNGGTIALASLPQARCSRDFCALELERGGRTWRLLIAQSENRVEERALAAACARADLVIADRRLPRSCRPAWLKADRRMLESTGGLAIHLATGEVRSVAASQGEHGWWQSGPSFRQRWSAKPVRSTRPTKPFIAPQGPSVRNQ